MSRLKDKLARLHGKTVTENPKADSPDSLAHQIEIEQERTEEQCNVTKEDVIKEDVTEENVLTEDVPKEDEHGYYSQTFDDPYVETFIQNNIGLYTNEFGSFLLKRTHYNSEHYHGMYQLKQLQEVSPYLNRFFEASSEGEVTLDNVLFFDLETTGLGTGTGNIPFMVGIAYFKHNTYIVEQAVIRHVAEERALLAYFHRLSTQYRYLVTYNGKTFDWPLLVNRFVLNGMREALWQPEHIDLLHPSRFIWRNTLESCKLSYIEEARLGITRLDDLPGAEAPDRYFKYLSDFNPEHLIPVFTHNELDMLTLVSLLTRFGYLLSDQDVTSIIQLPTEPEEMIKTGLWLEKMGLTSQCESLYSIASLLPLNYAPTLYRLSLRDKQMGNDTRAIFLWEKIIESDDLNLKSKIDCCIQLAMYYEHKQKQLDKALAITERALQFSTSLQYEHRNNHKKRATLVNQHQELNKRLQRLMKKIS